MTKTEKKYKWEYPLEWLEERLLSQTNEVRWMAKHTAAETRATEAEHSLREYFAAAALTGLLANPTAYTSSRHIYTQLAFEYADAMLEVQAKEELDGK